MLIGHEYTPARILWREELEIELIYRCNGLLRRPGARLERSERRLEKVSIELAYPYNAGNL